MKKNINTTEFIRQFTAESRRGRPYKRHYLNIANKIELFENKLGKKLKTADFDDRMLDEFIYFLRSDKKNLKITTIRSIIQKLQGLLSKADKFGFKVNYTYKEVSIKNEDICSIFLTTEEIEQIFKLKGLSKEQHAAREIFIIACCTGLRYSDVSRLSSDNLFGNTLHIKTLKTGAVVDIPVHWMIKDILQRNKNMIPALRSQHNYNAIIKRICKKAGIKDKVLYERTEGLKIVRKNVEKWQLVSSHTARRSLATNMYLANIPAARIMLITGHKTEQAFFSYIRINRVENAKTLSDHPFFNI